jgi:uncharacterized tellurite resistance protein B-like protein
MTTTVNNSNFISGLVSLYHLLINADGEIHEKELRMGEFMRKAEDIEEYQFNYLLNKVKGENKTVILQNCIKSLRQCDHSLKVKCIAWMSLIANSDGFMDAEEWRLIYQIYYKELKLDLKEILACQKELPRPM